GTYKHLLSARSRFATRWAGADVLAYEDGDGAIRMWDATTGREAARLDSRAAGGTVDRSGLALDVLAIAAAPLCEQVPPAVAPDVILSSPLPRAVQTAELLAASLDYLGPVSSLRCLEPAAQPRIASAAILAAGSSVIVVSHEPAISTLGAFLLGVPAFPQFR